MDFTILDILIWFMGIIFLISFVFGLFDSYKIDKGED